MTGPAPLPGDLRVAAADEGRVHVRREYRDPLGRPLTGEVVLTGSARTQGETSVVVPVPVKVVLTEAGVLDAMLPPDTYQTNEVLHTADGVRVVGASFIVVGEPGAA